jgi:hypothetical protein
MRTRPPLALAALVAWGVLANGCQPCLGNPAADALDADLRSKNRANAEPAMRAAAARAGAILLPDTPITLNFTPLCDSNQPESALGTPCAEEVSSEGAAYHVRVQGKPRLAIVASSTDAYYARLARRGTTYFLLMPKISRRIQREKTKCDCDGMPRINLHLRSDSFFVLDDPAQPAAVDVQQINVPMTEDVIARKCRQLLL